MASTADSVVQYGLSQIGRPYRTGADFTHAAYAVCGIQIPKHAPAQAFRAGAIVPKRALAEGDLLFPTVRIAGLYVGGGFWLYVSQDGQVRRGPVRRIWRAVRVVTPGGGAGLGLSRPGESPQGTVTGKRPRDLLTG